MSLPCAFERVRKKILQNLLQPFRIAGERAWQRHGDIDLERETLRFSHVMEGPLRTVAQGSEGDLLGFNGNCTGFDFGQVENIVDQREQVRTGRMDIPGKVHLLRRQVACGVFRQLLAKDKDRIQRRPQLVRHVRKELGLVLGRHRQLGRFLFQGAPGLLDFLALPFHLNVLLGKLLCLGREFLVGLLQLGLARLQFDGELLRLLQQIFRPHRRFDRVQHDANRLR